MGIIDGFHRCRCRCRIHCRPHARCWYQRNGRFFFRTVHIFFHPAGLNLHEVVLTNGAIQFGGSSPAEAPAAAAEPVQAQSASNSSWGAPSCEADARSFTKCLDENQGNMQICSWYLDQLVCSSHLPGSGDWVANA